MKKVTSKAQQFPPKDAVRPPAPAAPPKLIKHTVDGWEWYCTQIKVELGRQLTAKDCKIAMQYYINSVNWKDVLKEIDK